MITSAATMAQGWQYYQSGDFRQAEQVFREVVQDDPLQVEAWYLLGAASQGLGKLDEAVASYQHALTIKPDHAAILNNLGVAFAAQGKFEKAMTSYRQALQHQPDYPEAHNNLGVDLAALGKVDEAIASFQEAVRLRPYYAEAYENLRGALAKRPASSASDEPPAQELEAGSETISELCNQGIAFWRQGNHAAAAEQFEQALKLRPDSPQMWNNLGIVLNDQGKPAEAIASYQHALQLWPAYPEAYNNLGVALMGQGRLDEAVASYQQALRCRPEYAEAYNNLGNARRHQGRLNEAVASYQQALRCRPDYAEACGNLAGLLKEQGQLDQAIAYGQKAVRLTPDAVGAHQNLAGALMSAGRSAEAAAGFREVLRLQPNQPVAQYLLAVLEGGPPPASAPAEYVRNLFDDFAPIFDEQLVKELDYQVPRLLRQAMNDIPARPELDIVDLGCGTGLCGLQFHDLARTLTGIDLSPRMLDRARTRGVYDRLVQGDVTEILGGWTGEVDLIVAGDVLIYLGDLDGVFQAAAQALRPGGRFAFSVEANEGQGYVLRSSGRFAHSPDYVRKLAEQNGLSEESARQVVLRREGNKELGGWLFLLRREPAEGKTSAKGKKRKGG